jgi:EmrB/QacA subfamily drug resistance transporter
MDAVALGWVTSAFLLATAALMVPVGKLADTGGRKRVFTWGMVIWTVTTILCGVANSAPVLIIFRILQGTGTAMVYGTGVAILSSVFSPNERGRALGTAVASTYLGLSLGPFIGGLLTENLGWRSIFLVTVPLGITAIALVIWKLEGEWAPAQGERLDWVGSILCGGALAAIMMGLSRLPQALGGALVLLGALGLAAFIWWEQRVDTPVLSMDLFKGNRVFAFSSLAAFIHYMATYAVTFILSLYLQDIRALTPRQAGMVMVAQPAIMALLSPLTGRLSDRVEPRIPASAGMAVTVVGLVLLTLVGPTTALVLVAVILALLGFGFALFSSPNMNAIMGAAARESYGVASAMLSAMRLTGQMLSMGVATLILTLVMGRKEIGAGTSGPFLSAARITFIVFGVLCVIGVLASLARGKLRDGASEVAA